MYTASYLRRGLLAALLLVSLGPLAAHAQFKGTIEQVMEEMNDFVLENNTFQIVSAKPLHIRLSPQILSLNAPDQLNEEVLRAAVYGVYRTFIHTDQPQVQVTAQPLFISLSPRSAKILDVPRAKVTVTRDKALQVAKQNLGVKEFKDLVNSDNTWSDKMQNARYFNRKPGLLKVSQDLGIVFVVK